MSNKRVSSPSKRTFLKLGAAALGAVAAPAIISSRGFADEPEPIRVGLVNPLEGECAQWGIPIVRGGQIWADEHNAQGGILCGDGLRHKIEYDAYTNVCFYPNEELKAFKKAILEDEKGFMFQTYTPASRKAVGRITTQNKVLTNSYGGGYMSADHPYLMGGITGSPTAFLGLVAHVLERHPEVKRVALLFTDNSFGHAGRGYSAAGCQPYVDSGRVQVVYNDVFDPATTDYFPLLNGVLKEKPDAIFHSDLPPGKQAILLETSTHLKFDGVWMCHSWDLAHILKRVAPADLEGKVYGGFGVDASEASFNEKAHNMYQTYVREAWRRGLDRVLGFDLFGACDLGRCIREFAVDRSDGRDEHHVRAGSDQPLDLRHVELVRKGDLWRRPSPADTDAQVRGLQRRIQALGRYRRCRLVVRERGVRLPRPEGVRTYRNLRAQAKGGGFLTMETAPSRHTVR